MLHLPGLIVLFRSIVNLFRVHPFEKLLLNDEIVAFPFRIMAQKPRSSAVTESIN